MLVTSVNRLASQPHVLRTGQKKFCNDILAVTAKQATKML